MYFITYLFFSCSHKTHLLTKHALKINPLNAELNPICHLLALLGAHHILHVSSIRVKYQPGRLKVYL